MKCPVCQVELRITNTHLEVENDDTPNEQTRVFLYQDLTCKNRMCTNYDTVVDVAKSEMQIG